MTNQTTRVLELLKRFNGEKTVSIDKLVEAAINDSKDNVPNLWINKNYKDTEKDRKRAVSEKTIRRDLDVIKEYFPDSFELIRGGKGEKGQYKAITKKAFENFITPDVLSLMVHTFNLANRSDLFDNFNLDDSDKRILESKIKEKNKLYEFKNKPFETKKDDLVILKKLEHAIQDQSYITIEYETHKVQKFEIQPYKIVFIHENFYVACEIETDTLEFAMYRISKIKSIEDTSKTFHKNIEIDDFIKDMQTPFSIYRRDYKKHLIEVVLEVDKSKTFFFRSKKYLKSQDIIEEKENGNLVIKYKVTQEREIEELIKRWIPHVKVISPLSLKKRVLGELRKYLEK